MDASLRTGTPDDAEVCGRICFEAFRAIAAEHNFPPDLPTPEVAAGLLLRCGGADERIVGGNFLDER